MKFSKTFDMLTERGREIFIEAGAHSPEGCPRITAVGARLAAALMVEIPKENHAMARIVARI
jgi:hypothetical protein